MIKHVVLVKAKPDAAPEQVEASFKALGDLVGVIPGLLDFAGGPDVSVESRARGYTHGFVMTFGDAAARDAYLPHLAHKEAGATLRAWIDDLLVIDL